MIGFGNPLLDGDQHHPKFGAYFKKIAQRARDKQRCPETAWQRCYTMAMFGIDPEQREERAWTGPRRYRSSFLRLLKGSGFDSNGPEGAVLKGWVESRFGTAPKR